MQAYLTPFTSLAMYKTELYCMIAMVELIASPRLRRLNLAAMPKILRTHVTSRLHVGHQSVIKMESVSLF